MEIIPALGLQAAAQGGWPLCGGGSRPGWLQTSPWKIRHSLQTGLQAPAAGREAHTLLLRPQQWRAATWRAAGASLCSCFHLCGMVVPAEVVVVVLGGSHRALANKAPAQATPSSQQSCSAHGSTGRGPEKAPFTSSSACSPPSCFTHTANMKHGPKRRPPACAA